jgi:hypothetical protein
VVGDVVLFDESDEVGGGVAGESGAAEVGIGGEEILRAGVDVGEVAAASAGDKDFFASLVGVIDEKDAALAATAKDGAEEACSTGTEDDEVVRINEVG